MSGGGLSDRTLVWGTATTQLIGWGTLYTPFPLMVAPMEAELGWSRVLLAAPVPELAQAQPCRRRGNRDLPCTPSCT